MKLLIAAFLLILSRNTLFAQSLPEPIDFDLAQTWRSITAFYPRHEGSRGEAQTIELIRQQLHQLDIDYTERGFENYEGAHSFSRIVEATVVGARDERLVVAVPLNHRYGAERDRDGSIGVALGLALAAELAERQPPVTVTLLFLGAEREPLPGYPLGSRLFISGFVADRPSAVVYLDLQRPGDAIMLETATAGVVTPSWMLQAVGRVFAEAGVDYDAQPIQSQIQRVGLAREAALIGPYLEAGIATIGVRSRAADQPQDAELSLQPTEALLSALRALMGSLGDGIPTRWDRQYVFFQAGGSLLILAELAYLMILLALIGVILSYAVAQRVRFERYARTVARNLWSIPAIYLLLFVLLLVATAVIESYLEHRSYPNLWRHLPLTFFGLKLALAVFLFSLSMLSLRRSLLAPTSSFYSASALLVLFAGIATLAVVQISFSYYFLWAFVWAFLFAVLPTRPLKALCMLIAPLPLLYTAYVVYGSGEFVAGRVFLLSAIGGNLLMALIVLPFLLMLLRLDFLVRHPRVGRRSFILQTTATAAALTIVALGIIIVQFQPYDDRSPQPLVLRESIDIDRNSRTLHVAGTGAPLGTIPLRVGARAYIWSGSPITLEFIPESAGIPLTIEQRRSSFLERSRIQFDISADSELYRVELEIVTDMPLLVYDSNLPVSTLAGLDRATVSVGVLPPDPFTVDLTLPERVTGRLSIRATTPELTEHVSIDRRDLQIESTERVIHARVEL